MATAPTVMDKAAMKKLLATSKSEPVSCAIGIGQDAAFGLLLMDKHKPGAALARELKAAEPAIRSPGFGKAEVDMDIDPKLVRFSVNKAPAGMAKRLAKTLKGTGYTKVEIVSEDGTVDSARDEEEEVATGVSPQVPVPPPPPPMPTPPVPPQQPDPRIALLQKRLTSLVQRLLALPSVDPQVRTELLQYAADGSTRLKAADIDGATVLADKMEEGLTTAQQSQPDAAVALQKRLVALVQQVLAMGSLAPEVRAGLLKLASDGSAMLKGKDLAGAAGAATKIEAGIAQAKATSPSNIIELSPVKLGKAALLWRGMWTKTNSELAALQTAVLDAMVSDEEVDPEEYGEIKTNVANLLGITDRLNLSLADELTALQTAPIEARAAPLQEVRKRLDSYQSYLETDEWIGLLGDNEFRPVAVKSDMLKAISTIRESLPAG